MAETNGENAQQHGEELWRHSSPESTPIWKFLQHVNKKFDTDFKNYHDLYRWSVKDIDDFWSEVWQYTGVQASKPYDKAVDGEAAMFPRPSFFPGARLNFAQNLLYPASEPSPSSLAILAATETTRETVTWSQLRTRVLHCQRALLSAGIKPHDRIAAYVGNHANAVVAMLAATSLGAVWSSVSPDSGVSMVLDRLKQVEPVLLFVDNAQQYNGKTFGILGKVKEILADLPSVKKVVVFEEIPAMSKDPEADPDEYTVYDEFTRKSMQKGSDDELHFEQLDPDHPIYILYSSGTTGKPKCIVHGAIGTLIQHKKEHALHCSVLPGDRLFYFTTVTWMMWNWLVSGLASGAALVVYDGSPMRYRGNDGTSVSDNLAMARLIDELEIKHFGTSAKYLSILEQNDVQPRSSGLKLSSLRAIYNTASPLAPSTFRYVYKAFGPDIMLGSITGGTDIVSLFGASCPIVPVYAGEVQAPGLGMSVRAYLEDGTDVTDKGEPGDLVCTRSFPCQPVAFWGEGGHEKYRSSYFDRFPGVWHHGDFVEFNPKTGGMIMLGRSDGVLNPAGVRFGSAEIYNVLLKHFANQVADGLCIGRRRENESDETVVLFLKMNEGTEFSKDVADQIKKMIRKELSARHVPGIVDECPDIPVTVNGKKVEGAVKQIISGSKVKPSASVANAECLEFYRTWAESQA